MRNLVFINRYHWRERLPGAKYALVDYERVGSLAVEHLVAMGHRRVAFLAVREWNMEKPWESIQSQMLAGFPGRLPCVWGGVRRGGDLAPDAWGGLAGRGRGNLLQAFRAVGGG